VGEKRASNFEEVALPHLEHAYALARWLTRNEQDARDVVQEAHLRALHYYSRFRGGDFRPWLLTIVRNIFYSWSASTRIWRTAEPIDELFGEHAISRSPEELAIVNVEIQRLREALEDLSPRLRELIVLREFEGLSYREISAVAGVPVGSVMSGLSRARVRLRDAVAVLASAD